MACMLKEALEGSNADTTKPETARNPYLWSSRAWEAWQIGRWLHCTGRAAPSLVKTSRGSTYSVNDMKARVHDNGEVSRIS